MKSSHLLVGSVLSLATLTACSGSMLPVDSDTSSSASSSSTDVMMEESQSSGSSTSGAMEAAGQLTVTVDRERSEDPDGTVRTKATLRLTGVMQKDFSLGDIEGELVFVDPVSYKAAEPGIQTIAVLAAWWAGGGQEIRITHNAGGKVLSVTRIAGDEGTAEEAGQCTQPTSIADIAVPENVTVVYEGVGQTIDASPLGYCEGSATKAMQ